MEGHGDAGTRGRGDGESETSDSKSRSAGTRRRQRPAGIGFLLVLILYVFFIGGMLVADIVYMAGTREGRAEVLRMFDDRSVGDAAILSAWTSVASAIIGILIAVPSAYILSRGRFPGLRVLDGIVDVPIILPPLVFGLSLQVFFQRTFVGTAFDRIGLQFAYDPKGVVLVQVLIATAYGIRMLKGTFDGIDPRLSGVAMTLGSSRPRAFFSVTLSQARGGIVTALVVIWARALGLYGPVIAFVGTTVGRTEVLPTKMYLESSNARLEAALALALMMIVVSAAVLVIVKVIGGRSAEQMGRIRTD